MIAAIVLGLTVLVVLLLIWSYFRASVHAAVAVARIDATLRSSRIGLVWFREPKSGAAKLGWRFAYGPPETTRADVTAYATLGGRVLRIDRDGVAQVPKR